MNNIIKTAKLDFSMVRPYLKSITISRLIATMFAAINGSLSFGIGMSMCCIAMTASYTFSISEKGGVEKLFGMLPISKKDMVFGRYLYTIAAGLTTLILMLIIQTLILSFSSSVTAEDIIESAFTGILLFSIFTAIQLPGYYKFGSIKGRFFAMFPAFVVIALVVAAAFVAEETNLAENSLFTAAFLNPAIVFLAILLFCAAALAVSAAISVKILKNKDI